VSVRDIQHEAFPHGSLFAALHYPPLQQWSDRGGASRLIGEAWAERVRRWLETTVGTRVSWCGYTGTVRALVLLDFDRSRLPPIPRRVRVPDFLAVIDEGERSIALALDAKFDPSVAEGEQVSSRNLQQLLPALPSVRDQLAAHAADRALAFVEGLVIAPDHWYARAVLDPRRHGARHFPASRVVFVPTTSGEVYRPLALAQLIGPLARRDRLPVRPADDLALATYYFRLACACRWCWEEQQRPLLGEGEERPTVAILREAIEQRLHASPSAFRLVETWAHEVEPIRRAREALKPFLDPPVSAAEVEQRIVEAAGTTRTVSRREVWRLLRERYRQKLVAIVGTVPAERAHQSLSDLLLRLATEQARLVSWTRQELEQIVSLLRSDAQAEVAQGKRALTGESARSDNP